MSESRAMIVRAGGDPSRLIVVNRPTRRVVGAGIPGASGRSIVSVSINGSGHLLLGYSDGSQDDAGLVVGTDGVDGTNGSNGSNGAAGEDGRGIASMTIDGSNHLIITYTDASTEDAGLIAGGGGSSAWGGITGTLADQTDLVAALNGKASSAQGALADSAVQPGDLAAVATSGDYDDLTNKPTLGTAAATAATDYATAAQGATADTAVQPAALTSALAGKVDVDGAKVLSDENYTSAEKSKLAGLESSHWRGLYVSLVALEAAYPTASAGDYADVDAGTGFDTVRHLWDVDDAAWIPSGSGAPLTAADVKSLYESNADTNAFTDTEKTKLGGIATGATANANTDSLSEGSSNLYHTVARVRAVLLTGLSLAAGTAVAATDTVLEAFGKLQKQISDLTATVSGKQATLVSGTNIKTVNGASVLGSGDLTVSAVPAPVITESTTSRTLGLTDAGKFIGFTNASASIVTVAPQASVTWLADTEVYIYRDAAGNLTITPGAGVTLKAPSGGTLVLTNAMGVMLKRISSDTWLVIGQTVAA